METAVPASTPGAAGTERSRYTSVSLPLAFNLSCPKPLMWNRKTSLRNENELGSATQVVGDQKVNTPAPASFLGRGRELGVLCFPEC